MLIQIFWETRHLNSRLLLQQLLNNQYQERIFLKALLKTLYIEHQEILSPLPFLILKKKQKMFYIYQNYQQILHRKNIKQYLGFQKLYTINYIRNHSNSSTLKAIIIKLEDYQL